MHLLSTLLLSCSANVDNLAVAIAYGIKGLKIGLLTNLFIALVSAVGTFLSLSVGTELSSYLSIETANWVGSIVLIAVGSWGIWDTVRRDRLRSRRTAQMQQEMRVMTTAIPTHSGSTLAEDNTEEFSKEFLEEFTYESFLERPEKADRDQSGYIDVRESIALAFGLTLNNLGVGIGAGISNLDIPLTTTLTFMLSIAVILVGFAIGKRTSTKLSGLWAGSISGALVIAMGIYEYFIGRC